MMDREKTFNEMVKNILVKTDVTSVNPNAVGSYLCELQAQAVFLMLKHLEACAGPDGLLTVEQANMLAEELPKYFMEVPADLCKYVEKLNYGK